MSARCIGALCTKHLPRRPDKMPPIPNRLPAERIKAFVEEVSLGLANRDLPAPAR